MKKDKEWLKVKIEDEYLESAGVFGVSGWETTFEELSITKEELFSLIDQLDEPEKVVVPQFVADFIEEIKPNFNIRAVFTLENNKHEQGQKWALDNPDIFARAWLDGYSVEEEPQWVVKDDTGYLSYLRFSIPDIYERETSLDKNDAYKFNNKSKADLIAGLVTGTVEEITK